MLAALIEASRLNRAEGEARWPLDLVGELLDAPFDVALAMIRSLVLGDETQHLPQRFQALAGVTRPAERGLGSPVLGREVRGHDGACYNGCGGDGSIRDQDRWMYLPSAGYTRRRRNGSMRAMYSAVKWFTGFT